MKSIPLTRCQNRFPLFGYFSQLEEEWLNSAVVCQLHIGLDVMTHAETSERKKKKSIEIFVGINAPFEPGKITCM